MSDQQNTPAVETSTQSPAVPSGYWKDRKGNLVPLAKVKPIDRDRDALVKSVIKKGRMISGELATFRAEVFDMVAEFIEKSASEYGAKVGGRQGDATLFSHDGAFKLQIARGETKNFDERLTVAKSLIDECIRSWSKGANKNIQALVEHAFQADKGGKVSMDRILGLRRLDISDEKWLQAMEAIADSIQITGSKRYIRIYERIGESDQYRPIPLDAANV